MNAVRNKSHPKSKTIKVSDADSPHFVLPLHIARHDAMANNCILKAF